MPGPGLSTFISMTNLIVMTPYEVGTTFILILRETDSQEVTPLLGEEAGV